MAGGLVPLATPWTAMAGRRTGSTTAIDHIIYVSDELLVGFTAAPEDVDGLTMHLGEVKLALAGCGQRRFVLVEQCRAWLGRRA